MSDAQSETGSTDAAQQSSSDDTAPLSATWREWTAGKHKKLITETGADVVVVGSGYGGAVAALRLADKGYRVLLLERGSEFLPGEFPNDFSQIPKYLRTNVPGQPLPLGRASGLVEVSAGQGMVAVTGNGLGGGSLINAGVVIEPDRDVFAQDAWPASIRHGTQPHDGVIPLAKAFKEAKTALGAARYKPPQGPTTGAESPTLKTQQLFKLAEAANPQPKDRPRSPEFVELTMRPDRCTQCGDCASGCNVPGAKGDLRSTYLKQAVATGRVQIVTQAEVYRFAPHLHLLADQKTFGGWKLWVFATDAQHHKSSRQEAGDLHDQDSDPASTLRQIVVPKLIVSAGTLGSTQLLQRSQDLTDETLAFSSALGSRLSGNGDALSVLVQAKDRVNAVGHGADARFANFSPTNPAHNPHIVGPTITAAVDRRDPARPLEERVLLQDGAIPGAIARLFQELLASSLTVHQMDRWHFSAPLNKAHRSGTGDPISLDPLGASAEIAGRAHVWLTMGHDGSPGRILWLPGTDSSAMVMPNPGELTTYRCQQALFDEIKGDGLHIHSPLWQPLPEGMSSLMSGTRPAPTITTVHPLGGCPMSDNPIQGVVNDLGQVWVHQPSHPQRSWAVPTGSWRSGRHPESPATYPGLFVLDGSIVPTSLGCNPLLTITALAERAVSAWPSPPLPSESPEAPIASHRSSQRPLRTPRLRKQPWAVTLREELTARARAFGGVWSHPGNGVHEVSLQVEFGVGDFENALKVHDHPLPIKKAKLIVRTDQGEINYQTQSAPLDFRFVPAPPWHGQGVWPAVWTVLEMLPLLASLCLLINGVVGVVEKLFAIDLPLGGSPLASFVAATLAALGWVVLPTGRTVTTWFVMRGLNDIVQTFRKRRYRSASTSRSKDAGVWPKALSFFKQVVHSREKRVMHYDLTLQTENPKGEPFPKLLTLSGVKVVMYRATPTELVRWLLNWLRPRPAQGRAPLRRTYWEQIMDAEATIISREGSVFDSAPLFKGYLRMGQDSLFRSSTAQLGPAGDTTTGLLMMSGYALLALRLAVKTHIFDFRLPNYSRRPVSDCSEDSDVALAGPTRTDPVVRPKRHWITVERGESSGDNGRESTEPLRLSLLQYEQKIEDIAIIPSAEQSPVRAKAVLLLHAFGQSGLTFTYRNDQTPTSLARHLYDEGYEVWVLDSRMSTRSGHAEQPCNVDMMGEHDVPQAVGFVLNSIRTRLPKGSVAHVPPIQIAVVAQCIGSASTWMSVLGGKLDQGGVSKLYALVSSQVHPVMHGSALTEAKTWLPALVRHAAGFVPFAVRGPQDGAGGGALQFLDRLLSSLPVPEAERAQSDNEDAVATCRRIRFIEAPLFLHQNMSEQTIRDMPRLFGNANVRLFEHARRFVSTHHHRLVDEDGLNRYTTEENARRYVQFPVMLLHGERNELFDARSARDSRAWLKGVGAWSPGSVCLLRKGYGHLDVMLGRRAAEHVFPAIARFLNATYTKPRIAQQFASNRWRLLNPIYGPVLGAVYCDDKQAVVRTSLILDEFDPLKGPIFSLILDGKGPAAPPIHSQFVVVVRSTPNSNTSIASPSPIRHYIVARPNPSQVNGAGLPAYLAIRLDVAVPNTTQPFDLEVLVFRSSHSLAPITTAELFNNNSLESIKKSLGDDFAKRATITIPRSALCSSTRESPVTLWAACCRYPGLTIDNERVDGQLRTAIDRAFERKNEPEPAMALLLGDQIYADSTAGLVDPVSPVERYFERHLTAFNSPAMRDLQRKVPTLMTPDDHEWIDNFPLAAPLLKWPWPNWSEGRPFRERQDKLYRWATRSVFAFQKLQGPTGRFWPRGRVVLPSIEQTQLGPVRVFLLDSRAFRKRKWDGVLRTRTLQRLSNGLSQLKDGEIPLIACGSVVLPGLHENADPASPGLPDTWQHSPRQRQQLLEMLVETNRPFILLSGDYHVSAALTICKDGQPVGAAIVSPPLYAPLPYANSKPRHLNLTEALEVTGSCITMVAPSGGQVLSGSGLAQIGVEHDGKNGFRIKVKRKLSVFGEATPTKGNSIQTVAVIDLP